MKHSPSEEDIRALNFKRISLNDVGNAQFKPRIDSKYLTPLLWAKEFLFKFATELLNS